MIFEESWKKMMVENLKLSRPNAKHDDIVKVVEKHWDKKFKDHYIEIYNEYEDHIMQTTLSMVPDIVEKENLVMIPSGVLFHRPGPGVERNLIAEVQAGQLDDRSVLRKQMYELMAKEDFLRAKVKDSGQQTKKKQANSGFGITNNVFSFIFNFNASSSITAAGRAQTALSSQVYEGTLGDTITFHSYDEMMYFITATRSEEKDRVFYDSEIIDIYPTKDVLIDRLLGMYHPKMNVYRRDDIVKSVEAIVDGMDKETRTRVYYKNNIDVFILNKYVYKLMSKLCYGMTDFVNPNIPPEEYKAELILLRELFIEYVTWPHVPFRFEDRARHEEREITVLMDTDSNMNYYGKKTDDFMQSVYERALIKKSDFKRIRSNMRNIIAYIATGANAIVISRLLEKMNTLEHERHRVEMKNEFEFPMLVITTAKKSYFASVGRKEAHIYDKLKLEVKGVTFFKSSATPQTSEFIYDELLFKEILCPTSGKIDIINIIQKIEGYKQQMITKVKAGDLSFYRKAKIKDANAYADPMSIQQYKASWVWNQLNPENQIELPGHAILIQVALSSIKDLAKLEAYPDIYQDFYKLFTDNIVIGGGIVQEYNKEKRCYVDKKVAGKGINTICLPLSYEAMPEWMIPILDIPAIVGNNMSLFKPLYTPLALMPLETSSKAGKSKYYTNIIRI